MGRNAFDDFSRRLGDAKSRRGVLRFLGATVVGGFLTMLGVGCSTPPSPPTKDDAPKVTELSSNEKTAFEQKVLGNEGFKALDADLLINGFTSSASAILYNVQESTSKSYRVFVKSLKSEQGELAQLVAVEIENQLFLFAASSESDAYIKGRYFDFTKGAVIYSAVPRTANQPLSGNIIESQNINSPECKSCIFRANFVCELGKKIFFDAACLALYGGLSGGVCASIAGATLTTAPGFAFCMSGLMSVSGNVCGLAGSFIDCNQISKEQCMRQEVCTSKIPEPCDCGCKTCDYNYSTGTHKCGGPIEGIECTSNNLCYSYNSYNCLSCPGTCSPDSTCCPGSSQGSYICVPGTGTCCGSQICPQGTTCCPGNTPGSQVCKPGNSCDCNCGPNQTCCKFDSRDPACYDGTGPCCDTTLFPGLCNSPNTCCPARQPLYPGNQVCLDLQTFTSYCGSCDNDCFVTKNGAYCVGGQCICQWPLPTDCGKWCCPGLFCGTEERKCDSRA